MLSFVMWFVCLPTWNHLRYPHTHRLNINSDLDYGDYSSYVQILEIGLSFCLIGRAASSLIHFYGIMYLVDSGPLFAKFDSAVCCKVGFRQAQIPVCWWFKFWLMHLLFRFTVLLPIYSVRSVSGQTVTHSFSHTLNQFWITQIQTGCRKW